MAGSVADKATTTGAGRALAMGIRNPDRNPDERGASLVEFAVLAPLLLILVLGIVEFGWLFGQFNDVRHGAREGGRFAAVNGGPGVNATDIDIANRVCAAMDGLDAGMTQITIQLGQFDGADTGSTIEAGDIGTLTVSVDVSSLSNVPLITGFLPTQLSSSVEFRLEQDPTWTGASPVILTSCP